MRRKHVSGHTPAIVWGRWVPSAALVTSTLLYVAVLALPNIVSGRAALIASCRIPPQDTLATLYCENANVVWAGHLAAGVLLYLSVVLGAWVVAARGRRLLACVPLVFALAAEAGFLAGPAPGNGVPLVWGWIGFSGAPLWLAQEGIAFALLGAFIVLPIASRMALASRTAHEPRSRGDLVAATLAVGILAPLCYAAVVVSRVSLEGSVPFLVLALVLGMTAPSFRMAFAQAYPLVLGAIAVGIAAYPILVFGWTDALRVLTCAAAALGAGLLVGPMATWLETRRRETNPARSAAA